MILKRILQSALTVLVLWMVCPIDGALQAQSEAYSLDDWMTVTRVSARFRPRTELCTKAATCGSSAKYHRIQPVDSHP